MQNKIALIYKSKTGFTKNYAKIIADNIDCKTIEFTKANPMLISDFKTVVFGTRAHAGMIDSYKKMKNIFDKSNAENLIVFVTGAMPNSAKETINTFWKNNLSEEEINTIPHFYMQGGLCYEKMGILDKLMMKAASYMIKNKKDKVEEDIEFERAISASYDISSAEYAEPLIAFLKEYR